jgi:Fic family protein
MPLKFNPYFTISSSIARNLMRIEAAKEQIAQRPLTAKVLSSLRETARLYTTHYSTMIEGNRLELTQIQDVLHKDSHFIGRECDEHEIKGYYGALTHVEGLIARNTMITEKAIQMLHVLVMAVMWLLIRVACCVRLILDSVRHCHCFVILRW